MTARFSGAVQRDVWSFLLGEKLGEGSARKVFEYRPNTDFVVKVEDRAQSFQNIGEYELWQTVKGTPYAKWFAPAIQISGCGMVLLMRKTEPIRKSDLPERVPAFFADMKQANFGMLAGKLVAHDYGTFPIKMMTNALTPRMRKADWWA